MDITGLTSKINNISLKTSAVLHWLYYLINHRIISK